MSDINELHRLGFKLKFFYSMTGLFLGLACIIAGVVLGLGGVAGHTSWTASLLGLSTSMTDATPGVVIFVVGIFFVLMTRFKVRHVIEHPQGTESTHNPPIAENSAQDSRPASDTEPRENRPSSPARGSGGRTVLDYHTHNREF